MAEDGAVSGGNGEGNLGKSGIQRVYTDDGILLVVETKGAKQSVNLDIRVCGPDTDVITMLIIDSRAVNAKLDVNTVAVGGFLEKFTGDSNRCREGVFGIMNSLGTGESAGREFT